MEGLKHFASLMEAYKSADDSTRRIIIRVEAITLRLHNTICKMDDIDPNGLEYYILNRRKTKLQNKLKALQNGR